MGISKLHQRHPWKNLPHLSPPGQHRLLKPKSTSKAWLPSLPCRALPLHICPAYEEGEKHLVGPKTRTLKGNSPADSRTVSTFWANQALHPACDWKRSLPAYQRRNCLSITKVVPPAALQCYCPVQSQALKVHLPQPHGPSVVQGSLNSIVCSSQT